MTLEKSSAKHGSPVPMAPGATVSRSKQTLKAYNTSPTMSKKSRTTGNDHKQTRMIVPSRSSSSLGLSTQTTQAHKVVRRTGFAQAIVARAKAVIKKAAKRVLIKAAWAMGVAFLESPERSVARAQRVLVAQNRISTLQFPGKLGQGNIKNANNLDENEESGEKKLELNKSLRSGVQVPVTPPNSTKHAHELEKPPSSAVSSTYIPETDHEDTEDEAGWWESVMSTEIESWRMD